MLSLLLLKHWYNLTTQVQSILSIYISFFSASQNLFLIPLPHPPPPLIIFSLWKIQCPDLGYVTATIGAALHSSLEQHYVVCFFSVSCSFFQGSRGKFCYSFLWLPTSQCFTCIPVSMWPLITLFMGTWGTRQSVLCPCQHLKAKCSVDTGFQPTAYAMHKTLINIRSRTSQPLYVNFWFRYFGWGWGGAAWQLQQ